MKFHLERLNVSKSVGPDKIHPKILKALAGNDTFVMLVTQLFQRSYDSGKIPSVWNNAYITALHKKGDKSMASNYRPISLTCILAKVFEEILQNHISSFVAPMIAKQQNGFLPGKSCVSNLLECMDTVNEILTTDKQSVDILYLDFQKAFDSVPHKRLLDKLKAQWHHR